MVSNSFGYVHDELGDNLYSKVIDVAAIYNFNIIDVLECWNEPHRFFHTLDHLISIIQEIDAEELTDQNFRILIATALFHDIVYDPRKTDNEEQSVKVFQEMVTSDRIDLPEIENLILSTANKGIPALTALKNEILFNRFDREVLRSELTELLEYEKQIFKEFQFADYTTYKHLRIQFLKNEMRNNSWLSSHGHIRELVEYLYHYRPKIGVYAGSFNPFHLGHMNILHKAEEIFDKVIIAVGENPEKEVEFASALGSVDRAVPYHQVDSFKGFISDYVALNEVDADITIVRGLRNGDDLDYEVNQLRFIKDMKADIKVVYIPCDAEFSHISSSAIRSLQKIDPDKMRTYLP